MLRRNAKTGVLVAALLILVVEGFFVYRWYERYHGSDATSAVAASEESPGGTPQPRSEGSEPPVARTTADGAEDDTGQGDGEVAAGDENATTHTATGENSRGDYTYLDLPSTEGDPDAVVLVTPSGGQYGTQGSTYPHNIGVWYDPAGRRWAIFNQDRSAVPAGSTFEVVVPRASEGFVHRAGVANTVENATYLNDPLLNGKPDVDVSATQNWNPDGGVGVYNDHPVAVFFDEDVDRWAVYNKDGAPIPGGAAFNVLVSADAGA